MHNGEKKGKENNCNFSKAFICLLLLFLYLPTFYGQLHHRRQLQIRVTIYLNALYRGRYQHTKEHGVKITKYTTESANVTPELLSCPFRFDMIKYPRLPRKFRNNTAMYTENHDTWHCKESPEVSPLLTLVSSVTLAVVRTKLPGISLLAICVLNFEILFVKISVIIRVIRMKLVTIKMFNSRNGAMTPGSW